MEQNKNLVERYPTQSNVKALTVFAVLFFVAGLITFFRGVIKPDVSLILPSIGLYLASIFLVLCAVLMKMQPNKGVSSDN